MRSLRTQEVAETPCYILQSEGGPEVAIQQAFVQPWATKKHRAWSRNGEFTSPVLLTLDGELLAMVMCMRMPGQETEE